jgi:hypothetical protein
LIEQIQEILEEYFVDEAPFEDFIKEIDVYARCQTLNALREHSKASDKTSEMILQEKNDHVSNIGAGSAEIHGPIVELKENHNTQSRKRPAGFENDGEDEILIDIPERKLIKFIKSRKSVSQKRIHNAVQYTSSELSKQHLIGWMPFSH